MTTPLKADDLEWSTEDVIRLIQEYRDKPLLWNPNHGLFRVQSSKYDAWVSIARSFGCEVGYLRKKFNSIFASHRREKGKVRFGTRSTWFLYDHLSFLPSHIPNVTQSKAMKTREESEGEQYDEQENSDSDHLHEEIIIKQEPEEEEPPPKKPPLKRPRPPRIVRHFVKPTHSRAETVKVIKSTVSHKRDECDSFGEYIATSLRKHDERTRSMIKQAINNILFEQEMKTYNNPQYTLVEMEQNPLMCDDDGDGDGDGDGDADSEK